MHSVTAESFMILRLLLVLRIINRIESEWETKVLLWMTIDAHHQTTWTRQQWQLCTRFYVIIRFHYEHIWVLFMCVPNASEDLFSPLKRIFVLRLLSNYIEFVVESKYWAFHTTNRAGKRKRLTTFYLRPFHIHTHTHRQHNSPTQTATQAMDSTHRCVMIM